MRKFLIAAVAALILPAAAHAQLIVSANGTTQIGINDGGELDRSGTAAGFVGLGYNFTGQGGRTGFQDALTPGCPCEAWGVAANGTSGYIGQSVGNSNIVVGAPVAGVNSFTSNTSLATLPGLSITQTYERSAETADGALFKATVVLHNGTGAAITDLRYARAMDWDVPPTEFSEYTTFVGTGTTTTLLRSTDNGFSNADPLTAVFDGGIVGPINSDGVTGPADHGSLFVFGFGGLAAGADYTFNIFYGAAANEASAVSLLSLVAPELYTLGESNFGGVRRSDFPTFAFAFKGVGGSVVTPTVPEPATWAMMIMGFGFAGTAIRRRRAQAAA